MKTLLKPFAKPLIAMIFAAALAGCDLAPSLGPDARLSALAEEGRVYALVPKQSDTTALRRAARGLQYTAGKDIRLPALGMFMVGFDLPQDVTGAQAIAALEAAVPGSTVGVNHAYRLQALSQGADTQDYANAMLKWPSGGCRAKARVGMIDGGISVGQLANTRTRVVNRQFGTGSATGLNHGTEVASVLVNPSRLRTDTLFSANVVSLDAAGADAAGAAALVQALDWMAAQGVTVVNISMAGPKNKLLKLAVDKAVARGIVLVAAAGNQGRSAPPQFPAAFPSVVAVTAVDANGRVFRNAGQGAHIDFAAPGVDIFVPTSSGGRYVSGTSIASPFVAARIAAQSKASRQTVIADTVDLGSQGRDSVYGHGLMQAGDAC